MVVVKLSAVVGTTTGVGCPDAGMPSPAFQAARETETQSMQQAVEAYAEGLEDAMEGYMQRLSVSDESLHTREYLQIADVLAQLEAAFESAVAADQQEFGQFFVILQQIMNAVRSWLPVQIRFTECSEDIVERTRAGLAELRRRIEQEVLIHINVPDEVAETAEVWAETATVVEEVAPTMPKLTQASGWSGAAAMTYRDMAEVQVAANQEFQHLPRAMADAYDVISTLNRAVLIAIHDVLRTTLQQATAVSDGFPGQLFRRVAQFERAIERCNTELLPQALNISGERFAQVAGHVDDIRSAVSVLAQQWPTGTSQSGQQPGDTARQLVGWLSADVAPAAKAKAAHEAPAGHAIPAASA